MTHEAELQNYKPTRARGPKLWREHNSRPGLRETQGSPADTRDPQVETKTENRDHTKPTLANSLAPKFSEGGNNLRIVSYLSTTSLCSGIVLLIVPPITKALLSV